MLLTLNTNSLQYQLNQQATDPGVMLVDLPEFTIQQLLLRGLVIDTGLLKGWNLDNLHALRNRADQAGCPCLVLRESSPVVLNSDQSEGDDQTVQRLSLVARAAHRLGCNAMTIKLHTTVEGEGMDHAVQFLRTVMQKIDRMELNLLIEPGNGDLNHPERLINLIKKVGGFRVGTMPSFEDALASDDLDSYLQQTAPYAGAILATCGLGTGSRTSGSTNKSKTPAAGKALLKKEQAGIVACLKAIQRVGYAQILAIDYVGSGNGLRAIEQTREIVIDSMETS